MTDKIRALRHNSLYFEPGQKIYVDPFRLSEEPRDGEIIFITHEHYDHFSPKDIRKAAAPGAVLVMPESMRGTDNPLPGEQILFVQPQQRYEVRGLSFEAVRAYNLDKAFHPREKDWVGYVLCPEGRRYYIAGDTDAVPEAEQVRCDVAFLPVGGTYTMDWKQAAELANRIRPGLAVPVHYGMIVGKQKDAERFIKALKEPVQGQIMIGNAL